MANQKQTTKKQNSPKTTVPASPVQPKKSHKCLIGCGIALLVLIIIGAVLTFAGKYFYDHIAQSWVQKTVSSVSGGKIQLTKDGLTLNLKEGSVGLGSAAKWPTDMPTTVPEFIGKINMASKTNVEPKGWLITATTTETDFAAYKNKVAAAGWKLDPTGSADPNNVSYTKSTLKLNLSFEPSSNGLTIIVNSSS